MKKNTQQKSSYQQWKELITKQGNGKGQFAHVKYTCEGIKLFNSNRL